MTERPQPDPRELAGAFAAALEHLRDTFDLQYVPSGSLMTHLGIGARPTVPTTAEPTIGPGQRPAGSETPVGPPSSGGTADKEVDRSRALRQQAQTWSPATKLEYLRRHSIGDCQRCPLARSRRSIVFGVGAPEADIMFVGEAPGADEDARGEPFVGRAGQRLNQWIGQLGLTRETVYIANVLKCRPPNNRDPLPPEVEACSPFLKAQIRAIGPKVIIALGRHAGMLLSRREDLSLRAMRQARLSYDASAKNKTAGSTLIPLVVTYHPAYVLRQEGDGPPGPVTESVLADLRRALDIAQS